MHLESDETTFRWKIDNVHIIFFRYISITLLLLYFIPTITALQLQ